MVSKCSAIIEEAHSKAFDESRKAQPLTKRLFDIFGSTTALIILSPLMLLIALFVRSFLGRPVLFRQARPGLNGQPFELAKFRTMTDEVDEEGVPLPDARRLTRFGRYLRATSLDELPELWNVLKGDMSLVGPRPLLMKHLPLFSREQARRHEVRPGITGWAQVNGRNALDWDQKCKLDVWYVDHLSMLLDLKILAMTIGIVLSGRGIDRPDFNIPLRPKNSGNGGGQCDERLGR